MTSFPRQLARTRRFSLGRPRSFTVLPDGAALFLRSGAGDDPLTCLWRLRSDGHEEVVADPAVLLAGSDPDDLPAAERARRERAREQAGGIVAYATDRDGTVAAFALSGRLFVADLASGTVTEQVTAGAVFDPRPDPTGQRTAYVADGGLHLVEHSGESRPVVMPDADLVTWGSAEFIAAEEMQRSRGYWWSPDGERLLVARVDVSPVDVWHIADPANPSLAATAHRYPAAGTANANVSLWAVGLDGDRREVSWDQGRFPYVAQVRWQAGRDPLVLVQSRDQRTAAVLRIGAATAEILREDRDPTWLEIVPGTPAWAGERLVVVLPIDGSNMLVVDDEAVTPPGLQVRSVEQAGEEGVVFTASDDDPTQVHVWRWTPDQALSCLTSAASGVYATTAGDTGHVLARARIDGPTTYRFERPDGATVEIENRAEDPVVDIVPRPVTLGERRLRGALLLPTDGGDGPLPVLLDPYGGPHAQRVLQARDGFATPQWFADQGFAVLVVDGRGTPGRGPAWERAVHHDLATGVLEDQVDALHGAAEIEPRLDLSRVAIRGWSFGGFLAALAVLRRPDVFRAGIAGAPVTDWALYDTHYTERYLGTPAGQPEAYRVSSLVDADGALVDPAPISEDQHPPALLVIHGLADDNVVAAHSLRLSRALLAAGRPHRFLPLSGVTHMTPQEVVTENLLRMQLDFLRETLV